MRQFIVGRWGDPGCSSLIEFGSDGYMSTSAAAGRAPYYVAGDRVSFGQRSFAVTPNGSASMIVRFSDGSSENMVRC